MHIICPHCTTSYAIQAATLGAAGRTVRCSRCKEVWLARPEDAVEAVTSGPEMAEAGRPRDTDTAAEWDTLAREDDGVDTPMVDSPPIAGDFPAERGFSSHIDEADWQTMARQDGLDGEDGGGRHLPWFGRLWRRPGRHRPARRSVVKPTTACAAMGALVLALVIWRADVVRLLPQTGSFYRMVGLDVNLRGLLFKDVTITTEMVEGKPVLVIEGAIVGETRKAVDLPRLRFAVRDAQGAEIYAWNAVLEQTVLKPGDRALFKSRLASPPAEGRSIDIRFFNKRDTAKGSI